MCFGDQPLAPERLRILRNVKAKGLSYLLGGPDAETGFQVAVQFYFGDGFTIHLMLLL